jgi:hypothetical protein
MSTKTEREIAEESLQRIIRTETRLMTLGTKLGFDLKDDEDITVVGESKSVYLASLDVPYTSVIKAARRAGLHKQKVSVFFNGALVAEMPV